MAFVTVVIDTGDSIAQLNSKLVLDSTNPHDCIDKVANYIQGIASKNPGATVQVTTRDTDPAVATSGSGSTQVSLALS